MINKFRVILMCIAVFFIYKGTACTSAIISGKITADGRPILWKNRDTENLKNCVRYFKGDKYNYVAVVVSNGDKNPYSVWMGTNENGFSIMNTLSYNLRTGESKSESMNNGSLMKRALEICATVKDFKHFLDTLSRPMYVCSNYGVIDAKGDAFYFEVSNKTYAQYDVNDPQVAPKGYLVRTNFSFSGKKDEGMGYVRYQQADSVLSMASSKNIITSEWLFESLSRSFVNPLMGIDLTSGDYNKPKTNGWFSEEDFIARRKSSCAVAIQGVKPKEKAELTTMWTVIGYPPVTPAIPVWVKYADKKLPALLVYDRLKKDAPLCYNANIIREKVYSYNLGSNAKDYFNWELLFNTSGEGYMQKLTTFEHGLYKEYMNTINYFHDKGKLDREKIVTLYDYADNTISNYFNHLK